MGEIEGTWKSEYIRDIVGCKFKRAQTIKEVFMPEKLYKYENYCGCKIDTLRRKEFYLCKPDKFNDPFDCKGVFYTDNMLKEVSEIYEKNYKYHPESIEMIFKTITNLMFEKAFVTCFSEDKSNMALWNFYANQHTGYCIEFDMTNRIKEEIILSSIEPVLYVDKRIDISNLIKEWLLAYKFDSDVDKRDDSICLAICILGAVVKHRSWAYEREWRYIELNFETREKEITIPMTYNPSSIYLGKNFEEKKIPEMKEIARELNCKLFKMNDKNSFGYEFAFVEEEV